MLFAVGRGCKYWPLFIVDIIHVHAKVTERANVEAEIELHSFFFFFPWRYTTHSGCVFLEPSIGL